MSQRFVARDVKYSKLLCSWPVKELAELADDSYWLWRSGEGWVFSCLELQRDKVSCTYGGEEKGQTKRDAVAALVTRSRRAISENPPAKTKYYIITVSLSNVFAQPMRFAVGR
jgi:hypothetical protein